MKKPERIVDLIEVEVLVRCSWTVTVKISRDDYEKAVVTINSPNAADAGDFAWLDRSLPKSDVEYRVIDIHPVDATEKFRFCNRTACKAPGATWWNTSTSAFYCTACARKINEYAPGLCTDKQGKP